MQLTYIQVTKTEEPAASTKLHLTIFLYVRLRFGAFRR